MKYLTRTGAALSGAGRRRSRESLMRTRGRRSRPILAGALVAAAGLIGINGVAEAATGHSLILGGANTESSTTTLTDRGKNPPLYLRAANGEAPLRVNSSTQVARLNASRVGGQTASSLQTNAVQDLLPASASGLSSATYALPAMAGGSYMASFDVVALMTASGAAINCSVYPHGVKTPSLQADGMSYKNFSTTTGTGVVSSASGAFDLACFASGGTFVLRAGLPATVDFVRLDSVTTNDVAQTDGKGLDHSSFGDRRQSAVARSNR